MCRIPCSGEELTSYRKNGVKRRELLEGEKQSIVHKQTAPENHRYAMSVIHNKRWLSDILKDHMMKQFTFFVGGLIIALRVIYLRYAMRQDAIDLICKLNFCKSVQDLENEQNGAN